jgi:hypothetical protein
VEWAGVGEDFAAVVVEAEAHAGLGFPGLDGDVARALARRAIKDFVQDPEVGFLPDPPGEFFAGDLRRIEETRATEIVEALREASLGAEVDRPGILNFAGGARTRG